MSKSCRAAFVGTAAFVLVTAGLVVANAQPYGPRHDGGSGFKGVCSPAVAAGGIAGKATRSSRLDIR